jgi:hypothetical protein
VGYAHHVGRSPTYDPTIKTNTAGGSPAASHFLLLRQKKVTKEKATQVYRPCGVPSISRKQGGAHGMKKQKTKTLKS